MTAPPPAAFGDSRLQTRLLVYALLCLQGRFLMPGMLCLLVASIAWAALAVPERRPPIIDMHLHTALPAASAQASATPAALSPQAEAAVRKRVLAQLQRYNIIGVLTAEQAQSVSAWRQAAPARIIPSHLPLDPLRIDAATVARVKAMQAAGTLAMLGEVGAQPDGVALDDPRMDAFWQLAVALDLPVGIHLGAATASAGPHLATSFAPRTVARVLARHPQLRVYLMLAGEPDLQALLPMLEAHPQLYVDVGLLAHAHARPVVYDDLRAIVDAGFGDRVMFGSGNRVWPESVGHAIETVNRAPFLDADQKRDIFYNNAARFLRLSPQQIAQHQTI